jgi:hypothetical protein
MTTTKLRSCSVPKDPTFPAPVEGYVVSLVVFYKRGFGMPVHRFHCLLLWYYNLELYHQNPSRVLHIAVFMTLCQAYLVIDPEFNLWKYFFRVWGL